MEESQLGVIPPITPPNDDERLKKLAQALMGGGGMTGGGQMFGGAQPQALAKGVEYSPMMGIADALKGLGQPSYSHGVKGPSALQSGMSGMMNWFNPPGA